MTRRFQWVLPTSLFLILVSPLGAAADALPDASAILDQAIAATGGRAAHEKIHNRILHGAMEMPAMGLRATMTTYTAAPNLLYSIAQSDAIGDLISGTDGEVHWELTSMTGPRIKSGEERSAAVREARFNGLLYWRELYKTVETAGIDTLDGVPCYRLVLTPEGSHPENHYYDIGANLLRKVEMTLVTEMGTMPVESFLSDYREVDGILLAHTSRQIVMTIQEIIFVTESVEHNVEIPAEQFQLPAEVQALADREAQPHE